MSTDLKQIRDLVLSEILGTLTDAERKILMEVVAIDRSARELRENMKKKLETPKLKNYLVENSSISQSDAIFSLIERKNRTRKAHRAAVIVASTCFIFLLAAKWVIPLLKPVNHNMELTPNYLQPSSIVLQLPNGQKIALDSSNQQLKAGNVALSTRNATLSYVSEEPGITQYATLIVPLGKDYKVHLDDGSEVQLNSGTSMKFPINFGNIREISINGEAYIKVVAKSAQPFLIHLPHATVQVLGTEFNVNTYDSGVHKVSLVQGSIKLNTENDSIIIKPGQQGVTSGKGIKTELFEESDIVAWREGKYFFTDAQLDEICKVLTRWYGINVILDNPIVAKHQFSGSIDKKEPIEYFLDGIKATKAIDYYKDDKGVVHIK